MTKDGNEDPIAYSMYCIGTVEVYKELMRKHPCAENDPE